MRWIKVVILHEEGKWSIYEADDLCVRRSNYSAKQIFESTYLEEIGAYNYLIYLRNSPDRALETKNRNHL